MLFSAELQAQFVELASVDASPWLPILWKAFVLALLGIPGAFIAETRKLCK